MLAIPDWTRPLKKILRTPQTAEQTLEAERLFKPLLRWRQWPDIALKTLSGIFIPPHQRIMLYVAHLGAPTTVYVCSRGTSKCLQVGTRVIMADGSRRPVEEIRVGDYVMGPDSSPKYVLATSSGRGPLYRVHQTSAMPYVVNEHHILSLRKSKIASTRRNGIFGQWPNDVVNISVEAFQQHTAYVRDHLRGYKVPVSFDEQPLPVDPYFFGIWLGDGTGNEGLVAVTTADTEVWDACVNTATVWGLWPKVYNKPGNKASTVVFVGGGNRVELNPLLCTLRSLGVMSSLGSKSVNKHIPQCFISNSEDVRLQLLAGLIDSDGTKDHNGYVFTNTNERLARDVKYLADTLGFRTNIYEIPTKCHNYEGHAWRLSINGDVWRIPCRVVRKQYNESDLRKNKDWRVSQVSVSSCGEGDWAGFMCEGGLFMLEDGTVTHNSSVVDVLYASYRALFYPKRKGVTLSASGFRGGQLLYDDLEKWVRGAWVDQESGLEFVERSVVYEKVILRQQNYWRVDFTSASSLITVPTNDEQKLRGIRGNDLYVDEANFTDLGLMSKVADSFLNVLGDFKTGGDAAATNNVFYTTTIDYGWREFQKTAQAALDGLARDLAAQQAAVKQDWGVYDDYRRKGLLQTQYLSFDYTDTIIRRHVTTRDDRKLEITWPDEKRRFKRDIRGLPFTVRGENNRFQPQGVPIEILSTYPINRNVEDKLLSGETPEAIWLAEQRNVVDSSTGDVYPHALVDAVACKGDRYVLAHEECGPEWKKKYPDPDRHFVPPVMWSCSDPCVLGVDYAPGSRDFSAFVVIRVGPLAEGEFNPVQGLGKTNWANVIWAEQHRMTSHADVANKIREFKNRYNLVFYHDAHETDTWKLCRAIGLDMRGGGSGVRDELVYINKQDLGPEEYRIYDPLDPDERVQAFATDPRAIPMLDAIFPSDQLNDRLVEFTLGQMSQRLLYLPKDIPESERPFDVKIDVGYNGTKILGHQLRALQQKPTKNFRTFYMKGDSEQAGNKKDLWAAFIYAAKQLRAHVIRQRMIEDTPPPLGAVVTRIGGGHGRSRLRLF